MASREPPALQDSVTVSRAVPAGLLHQPPCVYVESLRAEPTLNPPSLVNQEFVPPLESRQRIETSCNECSVELHLPETSMQERRRNARTQIFKAAQLLAPDRHKVIGCTVRDLSPAGACLDIDSPMGIPQSFNLSFDWFRSFRRCEVKWRSAGRIGVAFM